jgi:plastocyanin
MLHDPTRCATPACPVSRGTETDTGFRSAGTIPAGGTYEFVFHGKGTYGYYCQIHGYGIMHGTITVT